MKEYSVKSTDTKNFTVNYNDTEIGKLVYEKWFSFKAKISINDGKTYDVEPKGFWGTTIELKDRDEVLLNFKMNWSGHIIIHTTFNGEEQDFIFRHKGILKSSYVLLNQQEEDLLAVLPDFKWNKFNYDYQISTSDEFDKIKNTEMLLLICVHCVNYYTTMMSTMMVY